MKNIGQIIAAILAIVGGAMSATAAFIIMEGMGEFPILGVPVILTLVLAALSIIGGILLILDKSTLMASIFPIVCGAMLIVGYWVDIVPFVTLTVHLTFILGIGFYIDPILSIVGGILGLVFREKQK